MTIPCVRCTLRPVPDHDLIPTTEAAHILGCSDVFAVHRLVRSGALRPAMKAPGRRGALLFARADVEALRDARAAAKPGAVA